MTDPTLLTKAMNAGQKLLDYCRANDWSGYDPYDALNSSLFTTLPFLNSRIPRLALTQALKRSPINIRGLLGIPKTRNPKGMALFIAALLKSPQLDRQANKELLGQLTRALLELRSPDTPYWCWGYSFPWQTRTIVVPRGFPNLVCTTFIAETLLDIYEHSQNPEYLKIGASSAEYIVKDLYWTDGGSVASFSYPLPGLGSRTHNANFLAAAFLCRLSKHIRDDRFLDPALKVARYSASEQHCDGSWDYGEGSKQRWVDNFHTGYNVCALRSIAETTGTTEFEECVRRGFDFYRNHFFRCDGAPRYFHNSTYPLDIHCVAQSIITLLKFKDMGVGNESLAAAVFRWAMEHMWDNRGFFYYRVLRSCTIRIPYMRWSQAWMLLALATFLSECEARTKQASRSTVVA